jgi:hypothetical protein
VETSVRGRHLLHVLRVSLYQKSVGGGFMRNPGEKQTWHIGTGRSVLLGAVAQSVTIDLPGNKA